MKTTLEITNGIYYLYDEKDNIVYIGSSNFCEKRIFDHVKDKKFTKYEVFKKEETGKELQLLETKEIIKYSPFYNKTISCHLEYTSPEKFCNSIEDRNLRSKVKRTIKRNLIPKTIIGGSVYYLISEMEEILKTQKI